MFNKILESLIKIKINKINKMLLENFNQDLYDEREKLFSLLFDISAEAEIKQREEIL